MDIIQAQADLRRAYLHGGPGTVVSGLVWAVASVVEHRSGVEVGFVTLFFGAMFIYPLALLVRTLAGRAPETKDNPYGGLVIESTIAMIAMLFAAWLILPLREEIVMPLAAIAVGTHYFSFRTAYGDRTFWLLAVVLTVIGFAAIYRFLPLPGGVTLIVGLVEIAFGTVLTMRALRADHPD